MEKKLCHWLKIIQTNEAGVMMWHLAKNIHIFNLTVLIVRQESQKFVNEQF